MNTSSTLVGRYALPLFLILTPVISLAIPLFMPLTPGAIPLLLVLVPAILAVLLTALTEGRKGVGELLGKLLKWRIGAKWYAIAIGLALGVHLLMNVLALALGWIPAIRLNEWAVPQFIIIGIFIVFGAVMEELGWRGYALPKLLPNHSAVYAALFIGVSWGIVHLGLILPGQMNAGTDWLPTILSVAGLSVILTWLYVQTRGSLVILILFHAGQNYFVFLNGGISSTQQLVLMIGVVWVLALILVFLFGVNLKRTEIKESPVVPAPQM